MRPTSNPFERRDVDRDPQARKQQSPVCPAQLDQVLSSYSEAVQSSPGGLCQRDLGRPDMDQSSTDEARKDRLAFVEAQSTAGVRAGCDLSKQLGLGVGEWLFVELGGGGMGSGTLLPRGDEQAG